MSLQHAEPGRQLGSLASSIQLQHQKVADLRSDLIRQGVLVYDSRSREYSVADRTPKTAPLLQQYETAAKKTEGLQRQYEYQQKKLQQVARVSGLRTDASGAYIIENANDQRKYDRIVQETGALNTIVSQLKDASTGLQSAMTAMQQYGMVTAQGIYGLSHKQRNELIQLRSAEQQHNKLINDYNALAAYTGSQKVLSPAEQVDLAFKTLANIPGIDAIPGIGMVTASSKLSPLLEKGLQATGIRGIADKTGIAGSIIHGLADVPVGLAAMPEAMVKAGAVTAVDVKGTPERLVGTGSGLAEVAAKDPVRFATSVLVPLTPGGAGALTGTVRAASSATRAGARAATRVSQKAAAPLTKGAARTLAKTHIGYLKLVQNMQPTGATAKKIGRLTEAEQRATQAARLKKATDATPVKKLETPKPDLATGTKKPGASVSDAPYAFAGMDADIMRSVVSAADIRSIKAGSFARSQAFLKRLANKPKNQFKSEANRRVAMDAKAAVDAEMWISKHYPGMGVRLERTATAPSAKIDRATRQYQKKMAKSEVADLETKGRASARDFQTPEQIALTRIQQSQIDKAHASVGPSVINMYGANPITASRVWNFREINKGISRGAKQVRDAVEKRHKTYDTRKPSTQKPAKTSRSSQQAPSSQTATAIQQSEQVVSAQARTTTAASKQTGAPKASQITNQYKKGRISTPLGRRALNEAAERKAASRPIESKMAVDTKFRNHGARYTSPQQNQMNLIHQAIVDNAHPTLIQRAVPEIRSISGSVADDLVGFTEAYQKMQQATTQASFRTQLRTMEKILDRINKSSVKWASLSRQASEVAVSGAKGKFSQMVTQATSLKNTTSSMSRAVQAALKESFSVSFRGAFAAGIQSDTLVKTGLMAGILTADMEAALLNEQIGAIQAQLQLQRTGLAGMLANPSATMTATQRRLAMLMELEGVLMAQMAAMSTMSATMSATRQASLSQQMQVIKQAQKALKAGIAIATPVSRPTTTRRPLVPRKPKTPVKPKTPAAPIIPKLPKKPRKPRIGYKLTKEQEEDRKKTRRIIQIIDLYVKNPILSFSEII